MTSTSLPLRDDRHFSADLHDDGDAEVLVLRGELDLGGVGTLEDVTRSMDPSRVIVIDAYELSFIDSMGLGALARLLNRLGAEVSVVGASTLQKLLCSASPPPGPPSRLKRVGTEPRAT